MIKTDIKSNQMNLPIGIEKDGKLLKNFSLRTYTGRIDRFLNLYREANDGKSIAYLAAKYLSLILETVGNITFEILQDKNSSVDNELKVHNLKFADFLYIYVYSRIVNISEMMSISVSCPNQKCIWTGEVNADLWTTDVTVLESVGELYTWILLRDGIKLSNGKIVKKIKIQPVCYKSVLSKGSGMASMNGLAYSQLRDSIAEIEGAPPGYILQDSEIDDISRFDLLRIDRQAGNNSAGLDMRTTIECPRCGTQIKNAINWSFDPFFDASVPSEILEH